MVWRRRTPQRGVNVSCCVTSGKLLVVLLGSWEDEVLAGVVTWPGSPLVEMRSERDLYQATSSNESMKPDSAQSSILLLSFSISILTGATTSLHPGCAPRVVPVA